MLRKKDQTLKVHELVYNKARSWKRANSNDERTLCAVGVYCVACTPRVKTQERQKSFSRYHSMVRERKVEPCGKTKN